MNIVELQRKLIAAARTNVPTDQVPYAFEKRVAALLAARVAPDNMAMWVRGLWHAAVSCATISLLLGTCLFLSATTSGSTDLSQSFERTLLASFDQTDSAQ